MNTEDKFFHGVMPSLQNGFDLFADQWVSHIPVEGCKTGTVPLFDDLRPQMMIEHIGPIDGYRVLELGPMEGHQTYQLERAGAGEVVAIEGNSKLWLRCLVAKNALKMRATYLLGDFISYMEATPERFDLLFASGVLYHMIDPVKFLTLASRIAPRLFLWTHYYDAAALRQSRIADTFLPDLEQVALPPGGSNTITLYPRFYPKAEVRRDMYCGGILPECRWMDLDGIIACLSAVGYSNIETFGHSVGDQGASICVTAIR